MLVRIESRVASDGAWLTWMRATAALGSTLLMGFRFEPGLALLADASERFADLGENAAMLLRNHGTLTVGPSIASAFLTMYLLERACAMQIASLAGGVALTMPSDAVRALVDRQAKFGQGSMATLAWTPLVRMLDRKDPSFRD